MSEFDKSNSYTTPTQLRWKPKPVDTVEESAPIDFVEGLYTVCGAGSSFLRHGFAIHMYACIVLPIISTVTMDVWNLICFLFRYTANKSMDDCAFCNADGDFLIVPQKGSEWVIQLESKIAFFFFLILDHWMGIQYSMIMRLCVSRWCFWDWYLFFQFELLLHHCFVQFNAAFKLSNDSNNSVRICY